MLYCHRTIEFTSLFQLVLVSFGNPDCLLPIEVVGLFSNPDSSEMCKRCATAVEGRPDIPGKFIFPHPLGV